MRPTNEKTFQVSEYYIHVDLYDNIHCNNYQIACSTLSVDIVSVDLSERVPFSFKRAQIGQVSLLCCVISIFHYGVGNRARTLF